jgi:hypothetical protein
MEKTCKIYKIVDNTNNDCYIGSTTQALKQRLSKHKCACNYIRKCTSYQIINNGDYKIELIEDIGIVSKEERDVKERYYIENTECINKVVPGRSKKAHYNTNKQTILEKNKEYREANKEKIKEYDRNRPNKKERLEKRKEKFTCECGSILRKADKNRHERSQKHKNYLESITI